jgi:hypothetical protein
VIAFRRDPRRKWTGADFESQEILRLLGHDDVVGRINRARAGRPVRRAMRAALRTARRSAHIAWPGAELKRRPAN